MVCSGITVVFPRHHRTTRSIKERRPLARLLTITGRLRISFLSPCTRSIPRVILSGFTRRARPTPIGCESNSNMAEATAVHLVVVRGFCFGEMTGREVGRWPDCIGWQDYAIGRPICGTFRATTIGGRRSPFIRCRSSRTEGRPSSAALAAEPA